VVEKYKLNLTVAFTILLITIWLIWVRPWYFVGQPLLLGAILLIMNTLIKKEKKPAKLLEFFLKSLVVFYVATSIIWFVRLRITSPQIYAHLDLEYLMDTLVLSVLPLSLFPVAISVIIYGIFRTKLKPWETFLSSWYVSLFGILIISLIWWSIQWTLPVSFYAGMALLFISLILSLLSAVICTIVYAKYKKTQTQKPT
jgi:hypothetical protein